MPNLRPLIGISVRYDRQDGSYRLKKAYVDAVETAGGAAVLLGGTAESAQGALPRLDGVVLTGGGDIEPHHFGEAPHAALGPLEPERDVYELELARLAHAQGVPVLGICRGCQVMAVSAGAGLYQDIPSQSPSEINHFQAEARAAMTHTVQILPGTRLREIIGQESIDVNSFHHQSARTVPHGQVQSAEAPDGILEGFEDPSHPFWIAVQWHPEDLYLHSDAARSLFTALVATAREVRRGGR